MNRVRKAGEDTTAYGYALMKLAKRAYPHQPLPEQALVNLSVEKKEDGQLTGYVRIRSKTQGIALSLGDKITLKQKSLAA